MEGGSIVEMGPHDQLLKKEGVYYNLVHAQVSPTPSVCIVTFPPSVHNYNNITPNSCQEQNSMVTYHPPQ